MNRSIHFYWRMWVEVKTPFGFHLRIRCSRSQRTSEASIERAGRKSALHLHDCNARNVFRIKIAFDVNTPLPSFVRPFRSSALPVLAITQIAFANRSTLKIRTNHLIIKTATKRTEKYCFRLFVRELVCVGDAAFAGEAKSKSTTSRFSALFVPISPLPWRMHVNRRYVVQRAAVVSCEENVFHSLRRSAFLRHTVPCIHISGPCTALRNETGQKTHNSIFNWDAWHGGDAGRCAIRMDNIRAASLFETRESQQRTKLHENNSNDGWRMCEHENEKEKVIANECATSRSYLYCLCVCPSSQSNALRNEIEWKRSAANHIHSPIRFVVFIQQFNLFVYWSWANICGRWRERSKVKWEAKNQLQNAMSNNNNWSHRK